MFIWIYRLLFLPALLVIAPLVLWKHRRREGNWKGLAERLGSLPPLAAPSKGKRRIWLQAASVGEILAIAPVVERLARREDVELVVTATTQTGLDQARKKYGEVARLVACFPIDFWPSMSRAWDRLSPDLMVLMEGERWPEHLHQAVRRKVPVVTINARLSDRSFRRLRRLGGWSRPFVKGLTQVLSVSQQDGDRFRELGVPADAISVTGNLKLDTALEELTDADRQQLRSELGFGPNDSVLVGASTWPGEEDRLTAAWEELRSTFPGLRLLLVPRHVERADEIEASLRETGQPIHRRSRGSAAEEVGICLADTTGELSRLLQIGTVVVIGRSLAPHHEGQTPVEAAGLGLPTVFGRGMTNFRAIAADLVSVGAAFQLSAPDDLTSVLTDLLGDSAKREIMSAAGRAWQAGNRGAAERVVDRLEAVLAEGRTSAIASDPSVGRNGEQA